MFNILCDVIFYVEDKHDEPIRGYRQLMCDDKL